MKTSILYFLAFLLCTASLAQKGVLINGVFLNGNAELNLDGTGNANVVVTDHPNNSKSSNFSGFFKLEGNWINLSKDQTIFSGAINSVEFDGTEAQQISGETNTFYGVKIDNTEGIIVHSDLHITSKLELENGILVLDKSLLNLDKETTIFSERGFSENNMVVLNDDSQIKFDINSDKILLIPLGDNSDIPEYLPVSIEIKNGKYDSGAYIALKMKNEKHPDAAGHHFLERYWELDVSGVNNFTGNATFTFSVHDLTGDATELTGAQWNSQDWIAQGELNAESFSALFQEGGIFTAIEKSMVVGIPKHGSDFGFIVKPDGKITLFHDQCQEGKAEVQVYNLLGELIYKNRIYSNTHEIDLQTTAGQYIIKVGNDKKWITKRVFIQ